MKSFIDIYFTSSGSSPAEVARYIKRKTGNTFIRGTHDLAFEWQTNEEFLMKVETLHTALKEMGVIYKIYTPMSENESPKSPKVLWYPDEDGTNRVTDE
ncbi:MAG: hypothetical protein M1411_01495 [Candidatus Thermoplasmatota archaeon]|nr:hypothetical protein [Candidatus Thermoplasmatota archaeon]